MLQAFETEQLVPDEDTERCRRVLDKFGFVAIRNGKIESIGTKLKREALTLRSAIKRAEREDADLTYRAGIASLGPEAQSFLEGPQLATTLYTLTGKRFRLTRDMSCLTEYVAGDQLGAHLDQPAERCALTAIIYLSCASPDADAADTGLQLRIYGLDKADIMEPPRAVIGTTPGCLVLGYGARIWHERPKLNAQERVLALTACFGTV